MDDQEKTIAEYVSEHNVSRFTINKAIERGSLNARKSGTILLIRQSDFNVWHEQYLKNVERRRVSRQSKIAPKKGAKVLDMSTVVDV